MSASGTVTSTLRLASQSTFIADPRDVLDQPRYPRIGRSRSARRRVRALLQTPRSHRGFAESTTNTELQTESCLAQSPVLPISSLAGDTTNGTVPFTIPFTTTNHQSTCATTSTTFVLDSAPGGPRMPRRLPPLRRDRRSQLGPHHPVIHDARRHRHRFVRLVSAPGLARLRPRRTADAHPSGSPDVGSSLSALTAEVNALARSRARLSVALYPDLLLSLTSGSTRKATKLLHSIDALVSHARPGARVELLTTPFSNVDASALAAAGLGGDVKAGIARGQLALVEHYDHRYEPHRTV